MSARFATSFLLRVKEAKMAVRHLNNGHCPMCMLILDRNGGTYQALREWFEAFQQKHPEGHVSCGARGQVEQESLFLKNASKAHFGQSAHNYAAALDIFENSGKLDDIYEKQWFETVLKPELPAWLNWYGEKGAAFYELPHVEVREWRQLAEMGTLKIVRGIA
jgi:hypothetical protein